MNNYKGVMLCSRPNEPKKAPIEKPFCARVEPFDQIGLNPVKKEGGQFPVERKKYVNVALQRHKDWLNIFKLKMNLRKEEEDEERIRAEEKFEHVKELGAKDRMRSKKMKEEFDATSNWINGIIGNNGAEAEQIENSAPKQVRLTEKNLKKFEGQTSEEPFENSKVDKKPQTEREQPADQVKKPKKKDEMKPKWAYTEKEVEDKEEKECEDLLDFVNNLDYDQYINDLEVQSMVKAIKNRIHDLKAEEENESWKENAISDLKKKKREAKKEATHNDENVSVAGSVLSDAKSVNSERSLQSIQGLKEKIKDRENGKANWDQSSQIEKNQASLEDRIAKHVADEVLRNYKHLGAVHSNSSIRKILEREAQKYITKNGVEGPLIATTKERELRRAEIDPNTLPYLHRNPAV